MEDAIKMKAKFSGTCSFCCYPFRAGRWIAYMPESFAQTVTSAYSRRAVTTRCMDWECFYQWLRFEHHPTCAYCYGNEDLTIDHIIPRADLGADIPSNLTVACRSCNSSKGTQDVQDWLDQMLDQGSVPK
jgi:hypothetical protein